MSKINYRPARIFAVQLLYAMDITGQTPGETIPYILESNPISDDQKKYGMKLVDLVLAHREDLDQDIQACSDHWDLDRIAKIDGIIVKIAMVELLFVSEIPMKVVLSEAVQIGHKFSTEFSGSFINGLLAGFLEKKGFNVNPQNKKEHNRD